MPKCKKELCVEKEKEQEKRFIEKIDKELTISEYDEIEYWLANVEVLDNTDYILNNRKAKILVRYLKEKQQELERLNNIIKEIRRQLDYLETYSSKEDVFEDMKRRLDRIDKIIGSDKE